MQKDKINNISVLPHEDGEAARRADGGIFESVPNLSEGIRQDILDTFAATIRAIPNCRLLDYSGDKDHNRSVFTFIGTRDGVISANMALLRCAIQHLDISQHSGVHPRLGILDVMPIIPLLNATMAEAVEIAQTLGKRIETELAVPVYLYEHAAVHAECRNLADVRRLKRYNTHHPTVGAVCVGARNFLIAYNINLSTPNVAIAKRIAEQLREAQGGMPGVKAIGLYLQEINAAQVSMNLVDPLVTTPQKAYARVLELATAHGVSIRNEEYIGLMPDVVIREARIFEQELK